MRQQLHKNRGLTLIELLICMAILSIVMVMVVQFMSTTTMAQRKTKYNLQTQTESAEIMGGIENILQQANYVRVEVDGTTGEGGSLETNGASVYSVNTVTSLDETERLKSSVNVKLTTDENNKITFDLVPDNYANYIRKEKDASDNPTEERKVIINMDNYKICTGKLADEAAYYPTADDLDTAVTGVNTDVRSYQLLSQNNTNYYVRPRYIYVEYTSKDDSGNNILSNIIYYFVPNPKSKGGYSIYVKRSEDGVDIGKYTANRFATLKTAVNSLVELEEVDGKLRLKESSYSKAEATGRLTKHLQDFYLSANAEGNSFMIDSIMAVSEYKYRTVETIKMRNSNVLSVRPQNQYKVSETGGKTGTVTSSDDSTTESDSGTGGDTKTENASGGDDGTSEN